MRINQSYGPKLVREYNELNILRFIKNDGPISRAELAKRYKISKAAVSEIIFHLLQLGYIHEVGTGSSTCLGGRKPILIEFNPKAGYAIGVEIKRDHACVALGDLNAKLYNKECFEFNTGSPLKVVIEQIFEIIENFQTKRWIKDAKPIGIGVAIPGLINYESGMIQESDTLKAWQGYPIKEAFEKHFGIETVVENDVKAISLGECRFGNGKDVENLVYLWVGDGLGAGIIINGELYRGVSASSGEIGYYELGFFIQNLTEFKLLFNGQQNFGDLLSSKVLIDGARRGIKSGCEHKIQAENICIEQIFYHAENHCPLSMALVREYGYLVGILCINLINTLNPEMIVIGGHQHLTNNKLLLSFIKDKVKLDVLRTPSRAVRIRSAKLGEEAGLLGAIGLILEDLFYMNRLNITKYRNVFGVNS